MPWQRAVPLDLGAAQYYAALGPLEREVAALIAGGQTDGEIDRRLGLAPGTTAAYTEVARRRLRVQAARWAIDHRPLRRFLARGGSDAAAGSALDTLLATAEWKVRETGGKVRGDPWRRLLRAIYAELAERGRHR